MHFEGVMRSCSIQKSCHLGSYISSSKLHGVHGIRESKLNKKNETFSVSSALIQHSRQSRPVHSPLNNPAILLDSPSTHEKNGTLSIKCSVCNVSYITNVLHFQVLQNFNIHFKHQERKVETNITIQKTVNSQFLQQ